MPLTTGLVVGIVLLGTGLPWAALAVAGGAGMLYGLMVLKDLFSPSFRETPVLAPEIEAALAGPIDLDCRHVAAIHEPLVAEVRETHEAIRLRLVARAPNRIALLEAFMGCTELARRVGALASCGWELASYLASNPVDAPLMIADELERKRDQTGDPWLREHLASIWGSRLRQVAVLRELEQRLEQITTELSEISARLALVDAQLVRLDALDTSPRPTLIEGPDPAELLDFEIAGRELVDRCVARR